MNLPETLELDGLDVTVVETTDALTYRFTPQNPGPRPGFPVFLTFLFVSLPLGVLGLVGYAAATTANRPEWELALTGVFAVQLVGWLVLGTSGVLGSMVRWWLNYGQSTTLTFTATHVQFGGRRVCELAEVRGLRLFVSVSAVRLLADSPLPRGEASPAPKLPPLQPEFAPLQPAERPTETEACLSLVIGEEGLTHGLFAGFTPATLRALADHIYRPLTTFRFNQGMMAALDPLSVVETTWEAASEQMHTMPATGPVRGFVTGAALLVVQNRWGGIAWCVAMFAGLYASGQLLTAAGFDSAYLAGHVVLGLVHLALFAYHLGCFGQPEEQPGAK